MQPSHWLRAEDVDWTAVCKRYKRVVTGGEEQTGVALDCNAGVSVENVSLPHTSIVIEDKPDSPPSLVLSSLEIEHVRETIAGIGSDNIIVAQQLYTLVLDAIRDSISVPRDIVDACQVLLSAFPNLGTRFLIVPLVLKGGKNECELAERLAKADFTKNHLDMLLKEFLETSGLLFPTDDSILFWQRCIFTAAIPMQYLARIIGDLDSVPSSSPRISGAVFALIKTNRESLKPYVSTLLVVLNRVSGVMVAPAKKALEQLR